jgi:hypothetical protein
MDYGAGTGDFPNPLNLDPASGENVAHPSLGPGAQLQPGGAQDARFTSKVITLPGPRSLDNLSTTLGWIRYTAPNSPIPLIMNEELLLLRAEANFGLIVLTSALADINFVRRNSGGLANHLPFADQASAITELLYNKRYSLLYEGGHSWVDYRRYGRSADLEPLQPSGAPVYDRPGDVIFPTLPIPNAEVQAHE